MGETKCTGFHQEKDLIFSDCRKIIKHKLILEGRLRSGGGEG